jgi:hypothetical protein
LRRTVPAMARTPVPRSISELGSGVTLPVTPMVAL